MLIRPENHRWRMTKTNTGEHTTKTVATDDVMLVCQSPSCDAAGCDNGCKVQLNNSLIYVPTGVHMLDFFLALKSGQPVKNPEHHWVLTAYTTLPLSVFNRLNLNIRVGGIIDTV